MPLMLYYRPIAAPYATLNRKALKVVDKSVKIDGRTCLCVDDGRIRLYLDTEFALIPVAFQVRRRDGGPFLDGLIEYAPHAVLALAPKRFEVKRYGRESSTNPVETIRGELTQTRVGGPLPTGTFDVKFAPGTDVYDQRTKKMLRVRPDGSQERIR
jgi:hypothetical protein